MNLWPFMLNFDLFRIKTVTDKAIVSHVETLPLAMLIRVISKLEMKAMETFAN